MKISRFRARIGANWLINSLLAVFLLAFSYCGQAPVQAPPAGPATTQAVAPRKSGTDGDLPFTRHPGRLVLTKHARCRMGCRHITEKEIHEVLETGEINPQKSDPDSHPDPKYAMEGKTVEGQHLRIVFAVPKSGDYLVVVTCIELGVEWQCDCR